MSWQMCAVVDRSVRSCSEIAATNFHDAEPAWLSEASLALLLINLKDALVTLSRLGERVNFVDDVQVEGDVTDLVVAMRNAICHIGSPLRTFDQENNNSISFARMHGAGTLLKFGSLELSNPYRDDVAFFYGTNRLLLVRQIHRSIHEAQIALKRLAPKFDYHLRDWAKLI